MLDTFKGDLPLALAAYNAGEQNVVRHRGIPPFPETRRFVARVLRKMGDKHSAQVTLGKPIPAPQWISRSPRPQPKIHMASSPPTRPTMVTVTAPRPAERAAQLVLHELEPRPSSAAWAPVPAPLPAVDAPPAPAPTAVLGQSP
jgi:hypothetical protein